MEAASDTEQAVVNRQLQNALDKASPSCRSAG
jgi:hypothetical protein